MPTIEVEKGLAMPKFTPRVILNMYVAMRPTGFRSWPVVRNWLPYFAGDEPKMRISVRSAAKTEESSFNAEVYCLAPGETTAHRIREIQRKLAPYEEELSLPMLQNNGNYQYTVLINSQAGGEIGTVGLLPVTTREIIAGRALTSLLFLALGAGVTLLIQWVLRTLDP